MMFHCHRQTCQKVTGGDRLAPATAISDFREERAVVFGGSAVLWPLMARDEGTGSLLHDADNMTDGRGSFFEIVEPGLSSSDHLS